MRSDFAGPVNIGSDEMVTINQLVDMVAESPASVSQAAHRRAAGVRGRNSDNRLIQEKLGWAPSKATPGRTRSILSDRATDSPRSRGSRRPRTPVYRVT